MRILLLALALALAPAARAGCDARTLLDRIQEAEMAFGQMDGEAFDDAVVEVDRVLACQLDPVTPIQAAAYHRVRALAAFLADDEPNTILGFQSALAAMPGYTLSPSIAPEGHPLRAQFEQARMFSQGETFELPEPASGWITIDGVRTRAAPAARPFLFQRFDRDATVADTRYVTVGSPVPTYAVKAAAPMPEPVGPRRSPALIGSGAALGVVSAALYGAAFATRARYDDAVIAGDEDRIVGSYRATNGLVAGSVGALAVGATLVVVGL